MAAPSEVALKTEVMEEEESGTTEEEDEEEREPELKYIRIVNDVYSIMETDYASAMAVHPKFLALGTHWGHVYILDHMGFKIRDKEISVHSTTVNQISLDENGDYMATCSDDGRVVITGLYTSDHNQVINFDRPVKAVAIDPHFAKPGSKQYFATGDDRLILYEKGFLGRSKSTIIHRGDGPIRNIKWAASFIAWSNDSYVNVYDVIHGERISKIPHNVNPASFRPELYQCHLCWKDDKTLLIGCGHDIKVCVIKERRQLPGNDLPRRYCEIVNIIRRDDHICGIAPLAENLVILSDGEDDVNDDVIAPAGQSKRPNLYILSPDADEIANDALSVRGYNMYKCNDYHLEVVQEENMFFIVSPKDLVKATTRDYDDHIAWLLEKHRYEEAMISASQHSKELKRHDYQEIGRMYLNYLHENHKYDEAARQCLKILGKNRLLWEEEVYKFARIQQLTKIAPYLPKAEPQLGPAIYEMVLNEFLQTNEAGFHKLIRDWPCHLYNIQTLIHAVESKQGVKSNRVLLQSLACLYSYDKKYDKALNIYINLQDASVFDLIRKHFLYNSVSDKIAQLMMFNRVEAVKMFLENIDKVPVAEVVKQLQGHRELLHVYLDAVYMKSPNASQEYHGMQVSLYADFAPERLLGFLKSSNHYPLQKALEECEKRKLYPAMVFLLARMGNYKQALKLIMDTSSNPSEAIEFCKEQNDQDLWEDLIDGSISSPDYITSLLHNIGTHVDPIILIRKIEHGLKIPGLRDSLVRILQDYNLQISLREGCKKILVSDCYSLMEKLVNIQKAAICVDEIQTCQACHEAVIPRDFRLANHLVVFHCKHVFHVDCLPVHCMDLCTICASQKNKKSNTSSMFR